MIKAIIFDVDGVLINSFYSNVRCFQDMIKNSGYKKPSRQEIAKYQHMTGKELIKNIIPNISENDADEMMTNFNKSNYKSYIKYIKIPSNLKETLSELQKKYTIGIATGRTKSCLFQVLDHFKVKKYFSVFITTENYEKPKPNPEPILKALKMLKVRPEEAVYIGDTKIDLLSAQSAKTNIIIFTGYNRFIPTEIRASNARHKTSSFAKIPEIIEDIILKRINN